MLRVRSLRAGFVVCCAVLAVQATVLGVDTASPPAAGASRHSPKKGACLVLRRGKNRVEVLKSLHVAWFYTWATSPGVDDAPKDVPFVPMVWGRKSVLGDDPEIVRTLRQEAARGAVHALLGFNEPDGKKQANMTVEESLALWPKLMATGLRLGSPAAVHAERAWMQQFMEQAAARKYRVDFVTVHWYGGPNAQSLVDYLEKVHQMYHRPIWITEFAVADWNAHTLAENRFSPDQVLRFMKEVLPQLERLPYVEAYAWFPGRPGDAHLGPSLLFDETGTLSPLGQYYASF